ncbi:hypothetical protein KY308_01395 [Candidatus Woesearchaeota archaeon]|nr:hypothetical protein [Candidatus Woesearchaeota archaeon]
MIDKIKKVLEKEDVDYWKIAQVEIKRSNIYFQLNEEEDYISGERTDVYITVYKKFGDKLGEATVSIKKDDNINEKVKEAIIAASLVKNPAYVPFGEYKSYPKVMCSEVPSYAEIKNKALEAYGEMKGRKGKINALEILTWKTKATIVNSLGKTASQEKSGAYVEAVITTKGKIGEQEFVAMRTEGSLGSISMKDFISHCYGIASEVSNSEKPEMFKGKVMLSGDAVAEYFVPELNENPVVIHSASKLKYLKISRFEVGKQIMPEIKGDKITIKSNPLIKNGLRSSSFDDNLVPAQEITLIDNSIMKNFFASKRFADYLRINPTGPLGNIEILPGKTSEKDFRKDGVCEIVAFSSFAPNVYSGDFTAEIRLGYFYKNGKKVPFRGGMLVGNCIDFMKNIKLSKETFSKSGYYGPKAVMFGEATVTGL